MQKNSTTDSDEPDYVQANRNLGLKEGSKTALLCHRGGYFSRRDTLQILSGTVGAVLGPGKVPETSVVLFRHAEGLMALEVPNEFISRIPHRPRLGRATSAHKAVKQEDNSLDKKVEETAARGAPASAWYLDQRAKPGLLVRAITGFPVGKNMPGVRITQFMRVVYKGFYDDGYHFAFKNGEEVVAKLDPKKLEPVIKGGEWQYAEAGSKAA